MNDRPHRVPSLFFLVPGPWTRADQVVASLRQHGIESRPHSRTPVQEGEIAVRVVRDEHLAEGFSWGRFGPLPDHVVQQVVVTPRWWRWAVS